MASATASCRVEHARALAAALPRCRAQFDAQDGHFFFRRRVAEVLGALVAAAPAAEGLRRRGHELLLGHVAQALGEVPAVAEGIGELAVALAPERLGQLVPDRGAGLHRARPRGVDVLDVELEHRGRTADGQRRDDARVGELAGDVDDRVAESASRRPSPCRRAAGCGCARGRRRPARTSPRRPRVGDDEVDAELHRAQATQRARPRLVRLSAARRRRPPASSRACA